jgi:S-methylmethionine-dependent homocysteine/selenocysteine methylase
MGTELEARGVATPAPRWSAEALDSAPEIVAAIHRDYAAAGAHIHTTCTFRTQPRPLGDRWEAQARLAVRLARGAVPAGHLIAGSIAPIEDCYRPDLSPASAGPVHAGLARVLADAGCDLLLCEAFPHPGEALIAVEAAVATGVPTWLSLTAGPGGTLLDPETLAGAAREATRRGAAAVLVNCIAAAKTLPYVEALAAAVAGVPFGAYANACDPSVSIDEYLTHAGRWRAAGATLIGGCCGTTPAHIRALAARA